MPRKLRNDLEPGIHHVFARGNNREPIFFGESDHWAYLGLLGRAISRQRWRCLSYCLMPNHVHLLLETTRPNLSGGMQWLHGRYARFVNDRHKRCGHLFQGRFGSVPIEDDAQLWMTIAYIARNPVASGLCDAVGDWPWSSHRDVAGPPDEPDEPGGGRTDVGRLLELLTAFGGDPRRRYAELVEPVAVAA